jgi:hypothetical protein
VVTICSKNWHSAKFVEDTTKKLFSVGIKKLVKHWNQCIEVKGDNIEK